MKRSWIIVSLSMFLLGPMLYCSTTPVRRETESEGKQELQSTQIDSSLEARKHYSFAKQYEKNKMVEDAVAQYRKALNYDPRNAKIHYNLGILYYKLKQMPLAKREFLWTTRLDSVHADAHYMLGNIHYGASQTNANYDSSLIEFEKTAALKPEDVNVRRILMGLYLYKEQYKDALRHCAVVTELAPEDTSTWIECAEIAIICEQPDEAIDAYTQAWTLNQDIETLKPLASLQYDAGHYEEALESYRILAGLEPKNYDFLVQIAETHKRLGHTSQVIETLRRMVALRPDDLKSISRVAEWYFNAEELNTAKEWIKRGLKVDSKDGRLRVLNGDYYLKSGREDLALAEYEKALNDPLWKANAQQKIWTVRPPLSEEEKKRREFFNRGKEKK